MLNKKDIKELLDTNNGCTTPNGYVIRPMKCDWSKKRPYYIKLYDVNGVTARVPGEPEGYVGYVSSKEKLVEKANVVFEYDPPVPVDLYTFHEDCGRMGSVEGHFFATEEEVAKLNDMRIYLGEVLGKHSEVYFEPGVMTFNKRDLPPESIKVIVDVFGAWGGLGGNVFDCLAEKY